jgi:PAS domain S-box-containing protein
MTGEASHPNPVVPTAVASVLEATPDGVVVVDDGAVIVYVSEFAAEMFGWRVKDLLGSTISALLPERVHDVHSGHVESFFGTPRRRRMGEVTSELRGRRQDGSEFPVEISLSPMEVDGAELVIATVRDTSERQAERERLAASERAFRSAFEDAPVPMFLADMSDSRNRKFLAVNAAWEDFLGRTGAELEGRSISEVIREDARPTPQEYGDASEVAVYEDEVPYVHRDGSTRWGLLSTRSQMVDGQRRRIAHVVDITKQVLAEGERDRREAQLEVLTEVRRRLLMEEDRDAILGYVCSAGRSLLQAAAVTIALATGDGELELVAIDSIGGRVADRRRFPVEGTFVGDVLMSGVAAISNTSRAAGPVGERVAEPLQSAEGTTEGVLVVAQREDSDGFSVADRRLISALAVEAGVSLELDQVRRDRRRLLVGADRDRIARELHDVVIQRLFAAGMSLQAGLGSPDLAKRVTDTIDELDDTIRSIRNSIFRLTEPTHSLVDQINVVLERFRRDNVEVALRLDGDPTWIPEPVALHLEPVVGELLSNAVRHGGATSVRVELVIERDRWLVVKVTDNGSGLATVPVENSGLGLANLTERARSLNGSFELSPGSAGGATAAWTVAFGGTP